MAKVTFEWPKFVRNPDSVKKKCFNAEEEADWKGPPKSKPVEMPDTMPLEPPKKKRRRRKVKK